MVLYYSNIIGRMDMRAAYEFCSWSNEPCEGVEALAPPQNPQTNLAKAAEGLLFMSPRYSNAL